MRLFMALCCCGVLLLLLVAAGCKTEPCVEGRTVTCPCVTGGTGIHTCGADGRFGPCDCGEMPDSGAGSTDGGSDAGTDSGSDAGTDSGTDAGTDAGLPLFAGLTSPQMGGWSDGMSTGFVAGVALCTAAFGASADVCTYTDLLAAEGAGELASVPAGITMWVHRLVVADVAGTPTQPGLGGRCIDWSTVGNNLADGEFVSFASTGVPTYNLDPDTFFDGVDMTHTAPGLLECDVPRAIPCCNRP